MNNPYYATQRVIGEKLTITPQTISGTLTHRPILPGTILVRVCKGSLNYLKISFDAKGDPGIILMGEELCKNATHVDRTQTFANNDNGTIIIKLDAGAFSEELITFADYDMSIPQNKKTITECVTGLFVTAISTATTILNRLNERLWRNR